MNVSAGLEARLLDAPAAISRPRDGCVEEAAIPTVDLVGDCDKGMVVLDLEEDLACLLSLSSSDASGELAGVGRRALVWSRLLIGEPPRCDGEMNKGAKLARRLAVGLEASWGERELPIGRERGSMGERDSPPRWDGERGWVGEARGIGTASGALRDKVPGRRDELSPVTPRATARVVAVVGGLGVVVRATVDAAKAGGGVPVGGLCRDTSQELDVSAASRGMLKIANLLLDVDGSGGWSTFKSAGGENSDGSPSGGVETFGPVAERLRPPDARIVPSSHPFTGGGGAGDDPSRLRLKPEALCGALDILMGSR